MLLLLGQIQSRTLKTAVQEELCVALSCPVVYHLYILARGRTIKRSLAQQIQAPSCPRQTEASSFSVSTAQIEEIWCLCTVTSILSKQHPLLNWQV